MPGPKQLHVFFTAPNIHPQATGEEFVAWKWAEALSELVELTVFSFERASKAPLADTLPRARVITAPMPRLFSKVPRIEAMAKPHYPLWMRAARKALRGLAGEIDLAHQIMPQAARYPVPFRGMEVPYIVGPLGGALETPLSFQGEAAAAAWYTRARVLDKWRFRHDPWLRGSYAEADIVMGVAPYMRDVLSDIPLRRFEPVLELGIDALPDLPARDDAGPIKLLHVGRGVRTKGLRDVVRALARLKERYPDMTLDSAGTGEEIAICEAEARALGVRDRITFHGLLPRDQVEHLYRAADIFVFPSFREPAGNVLYEAMRWGLPTIAAARGGPDYIVDDTNGIRIPVTDPDTYARDIASAIEALADDPKKRQEMGMAGRRRLEREGLWPVKARALVQIYQSVLADKETQGSRD